MYLLAGVGELHNKTSTQKNVVVAAFMLFGFSYNVSADTIIQDQMHLHCKQIITSSHLSRWAAPQSHTSLALKFQMQPSAKRLRPLVLRGM